MEPETPTPPVSFNVSPQFICVAIPSLLSQSPLENFYIYPTSSYPGVEHGFSTASELVWKRVLQDHSKTLRRVSIHRILVSFNVLEMICKYCSNLKELFVVVAPINKFKVSAKR